MAKKAQRPVDLKDMPWSYIGKDALDAAAERVWRTLRADPGVMGTEDTEPYHLLWSDTQATVQRAVLEQLGTTVPAMLRQRAKELKADGIDVDNLIDLADELETDHG